VISNSNVHRNLLQVASKPPGGLVCDIFPKVDTFGRFLYNIDRQQQLIPYFIGGVQDQD
jgi:hypothetical protein